MRLIAVLLAGFFLAISLPAQQAQTPEEKLRAQQDELARIRKEREDLQKKMSGLQNTAHDLSDEVRLLDKQHNATQRVVRSLDQQLRTIHDEVTVTTNKLAEAETESIEKKAILQNRLTEIYKRGPLFTTEVLFSANSFGDLVARYKYLHLLALHDRALMERVEALRNTIATQHRQLVQLQFGVTQNREEKAQEEERLRNLEQKRVQSLARVQADAKKTKARLGELAKAEARLNNILASLESRRRSGSAARIASTIRTSDLGRLDWPVEGTILYQFGRVINPNNTTTRWNGMGIEAAAGTPVKSVASGTVALNDLMGTYGRTVIVDHGGGDYSVYSSLQRSAVTKGSRVTKGQTIGTVGATDPSLPPHLHFEIRRGGGPAVDPFEWLRGTH